MAVAFLMFYQANPLYAVIVIILFLGLYLLYKRRKNTRFGGRSTLFSGRGSQQNDLVDLIFVQQLINSSKNHDVSGYKGPDKKTIEIERIKREILELFDN